MAQQVLDCYQRRVGAVLAQIFDAHQGTSLLAAMRYSTLAGGKRLRAALTYATGECCGADGGVLDQAAASIECMHAFSLIHDDLPAMDDDALRRGMPTCHVVFDEATAILAGDALQTLAFELLSAPQSKLVPAQQLAMVRCLATASGANGMAGGQWLDVTGSHFQLSHVKMKQVHALKTGCLIEASVLLGVLASPHWQHRLWKASLHRFAEHLGVAFQIQDDILDVTSSTETLGKAAGKDAQQGKNNFAVRLGVDVAKQQVAEHLDQAKASLKAIPNAVPLLAIADCLAAREY